MIIHLSRENKSYRIPHGQLRLSFVTKAVSWKFTRIVFRVFDVEFVHKGL